MRISDWSSDVCSSDLSSSGISAFRAKSSASSSTAIFAAADSSSKKPRSEEHTSELQSLMRISYAVFCLKKKKKTANVYIQGYEQSTHNKHVCHGDDEVISSIKGSNIIKHY